MTRHCKGCPRTFEANDCGNRAPKEYCTDACRKRARNRRTKARAAVRLTPRTEARIVAELRASRLALQERLCALRLEVQVLTRGCWRLA